MYRYKTVIRSAQFRRELKKAEKRGLNPLDVEAVIDLLRTGKPLPEKYHDHPLKGKYKGYRDCHINPDWLLIYKKEEDELILFLAHTGTHSDLF
ncbi:MAG: type II toxin-antitoxin system YafQ family toxin [Synergistaceae bacterium]|nr:type II toxin-antitoxin system YafQ family toxin [Synergistaceae bacterium]MBR0167947.1 type II toxin-antitoxin system YafQ family toxin [Synergistaceae bacterium]